MYKQTEPEDLNQDIEILKLERPGRRDLRICLTSDATRARMRRRAPSTINHEKAHDNGGAVVVGWGEDYSEQSESRIDYRIAANAILDQLDNNTICELMLWAEGWTLDRLAENIETHPRKGKKITRSGVSWRMKQNLKKARKAAARLGYTPSNVLR